MRHSFLDRYSGLDSPLHMIEVRTKVIAFGTFLLAVLWVPQGANGTFFVYFLLVAVYMGISQIPLSYLLGRTLIILPFLLLAALSAPWKPGGWFPWISAIVFRALLSVLILVLLTSTTRFPELLRGFGQLGFPRILILNLAFLYRYLFVMIEEVMRMRLARDCRRTRRARMTVELKILASMLGTLLVRSFERAERLYQAMLSRALAGELPVFQPRPFSWKDAAFLAAHTFFLAFTLHRAGRF